MEPSRDTNITRIASSRGIAIDSLQWSLIASLLEAILEMESKGIESRFGGGHSTPNGFFAEITVGELGVVQVFGPRKLRVFADGNIARGINTPEAVLDWVKSIGQVLPHQIGAV